MRKSNKMGAKRKFASTIQEKIIDYLCDVQDIKEDCP